MYHQEHILRQVWTVCDYCEMMEGKKRLVPCLLKISYLLAFCSLLQDFDQENIALVSCSVLWHLAGSSDLIRCSMSCHQNCYKRKWDVFRVDKSINSKLFF